MQAALRRLRQGSAHELPEENLATELLRNDKNTWKGYTPEPGTPTNTLTA
jgi:hypothetical protein